MPRHHISLEYAHIYTDEMFGDEHAQAAQEARRQVEWLSRHEVSAVVLIDNYNPINHTLVVDEYLGRLRGVGLEPHAYAFEADMVPYAPLLLERVVDRRVRRSYERYIEQHGHYPCSLLAAAWYWLRLGILQPGPELFTPAAAWVYQPADYLLNVLPDRFAPVEARINQLLAATDQPDSRHRIERIFFSAPSVAPRSLA